MISNNFSWALYRKSYKTEYFPELQINQKKKKKRNKPTSTFLNKRIYLFDFSTFNLLLAGSHKDNWIYYETLIRGKCICLFPGKVFLKNHLQYNNVELTLMEIVLMEIVFCFVLLI